MKKRKVKKFYFSNQKVNIGKVSKFIIIVLVFGMILGHINISAIVKAMEEEIHTVSYSNVSKDLEDLSYVSEIEALRSANTKTYLKENGIYETEYYTENVHYKNNGIWEEIDNSLILYDNNYKNKNNRFSVSLPSKLKGDEKVVINYNNNELKIYYDNISEITGKLNGDTNRNRKNLKDKIEYKKSNSEVIEYIIKQDSIKENIILNEYIPNYTFSYYIDTFLRIERIGNKLYFFNDKDIIYVMNDYYMYDSLNSISTDIDYYISVIDNDTYKIDVIVSDEYLKTAAYPVVIDPEITVRDGGVTDGVFTVTTLDKNTDDEVFLDSGTFTLENRSITTTNDDKVAYFDVSILSDDIGEANANNLCKTQFMYANITLPTLSTNVNNESSVVLKSVTKSGESEIDYLDSTSFVTSEITREYFYRPSVFDHKFDIYNLVKENLSSLEDSSINLKFELSLDSAVSNKTVTYSLGGDAVGDAPVLKLGYLSDAGLANYYTYESFPVSEDVNIYAAHNSGNITLLLNDYNDNCYLSLSHIYNANRKHKNNFYGNGYSINYNEYITTLFYDEVLLLTKGDGREVTYYSQNEDNTLYLAGDGSGDIIRRILDEDLNVDRYELVSSNGTLNEYNSNGRLIKVYFDNTDLANSDKITIYSSSNGRINEVIDSIGNYISFSYNSSNLLDEITIYKYDLSTNSIKYAGKVVYQYENSNLINVKKYLYNTLTRDIEISYNNNFIIGVKENSRGYEFIYDGQNRVTRVNEAVGELNNLNYLEFSYNTNGKKTIVTNGLGEKVVYTFDDYYHTNSVTTHDGYTTFYKYNDIYYNDDGSLNTSVNYNQNHKIIVQSSSFKNSVNLLDNHGFEILSNSGIYGWTDAGEANSYAAYETANILYGSIVLKLYGTSVEAAKVYQDIEVVSGKEYVVSGYIKNANLEGGSYIDVVGIDGVVTPTTRSSNILNSNDFCRYEYRFTASFSGTVRIYLVNESSGFSYFDNISVNTSYIDTRYNYLSNSSFEKLGSTSEVIPGWSVENYTYKNNSDGYFHDSCGEKRVRLLNESYLRQTINVYGLAGDVFVFGGHCYYENYTGSVSVKLTLNTERGTTSKVFTFTDCDLNASVYMDKITAPYDYTSVTIEIVNNSISSYAEIDNFAIYKEGYGINVTYTQEGLVEEEYNEITKNTTSYTYYEGTRNVKEITTDSEVTEFGYDSHNNLTSLETDNVVTTFDVDSYGACESVTISTNDSNNKYFSGTTVSVLNGLYPKTQTDINGTITTNTYDYITGLVTNINTYNEESNININDSYTYDNLGKVLTNTKSSTGLSKTVSYSYDIYGALTTITDGSSIYNIEYNEYGDILKISLNTLELIEYNYVSDEDVYTGKVEKAEYNYGTISFDYNEEHYIDKIYHNDILVLNYTYNDYGEIASYTDYKENVTYYYNYDYQNRLINVNSSNGNNFTYTYDDNSNLVSSRNINGVNYYEYNSNDVITTEVISSFYKKTYGYSNDSYEQLEVINYYLDDFSLPYIQTSYTYETITINNESIYTGNIKEVTYLIDGYSYKYVYEYDDFNNITKITQYKNNNLVYIKAYTYDIFNQLKTQSVIREEVEHKTYYEYDLKGNITNIREVNEEKGDVTSNISMQYNQLNELVVVNDNGTVYNNIYNSSGILTKYLGWNVAYNMRNISALETAEHFLEFSYNANGIRTSKRYDNNNPIYYTLDGSKIIKEEQFGSNGYVINYYYEQNGSLIGFNYDNNYYLYQKNIQNDIIGIIDINGNLLVEYTYDAYGNVLYMQDESTNNIGTINPFRYRSYYYDNETGWYYLNSRYYNPQLGRFVTMDDVEYLGASGSLLGYNLYSYCENNPVNMVDPSGNDAILVVDYNSGPGLPIVGHARLYYEYKGVWYRTEFNKEDGVFKVTNDMMKNMTKESIIKGFNDNIQYLCIAGNFEICYYYANYSIDYYPEYHLIRNNCLHYVKKVLFFGTIYNSYLSKYLKKSLQYVPAVYITAAISINYVTKHTLQNMPSAPQIAKKNNNYLLRRIY